MKMAGYRNICFTSWNVVDEKEDFRLVCDMLKFDPKVVYALAGLETGGKTGKVHIQGYVCFENPVMFSRLKKLLNDYGLHCEAAKGTHQDSRDYIFHEGKHKDKAGELLLPAWEFGVMPKEGRGRPSYQQEDENSFDAVMKGIWLGKTDAELMQDFPAVYLRFYGNILKVRDYMVNGGGWRDMDVLMEAKEKDEVKEEVVENG